MHDLTIEPLTKIGFAKFGEVVEIEGTESVGINQGFAVRFDRLARIDVANKGGVLNVSLFSAKKRPQPIAIELMERHPLGSQLFYPLQDTPWLVAVCENPRDIESYRAFLATGRQGVNYARNVWHHPLLVLNDNERFIVLDRGGSNDNLEEVSLDATQILHLAPQPLSLGETK